MNDELVSDWVAKAEDDWYAVDRLKQDIDRIPAIVGYLCQQCAEKYLKAVIQSLGTTPPRIHDTSLLLDRVVGQHTPLYDLRKDCELLAPYATHARYPGEPPSVADVEQAIAAAERVRKAARQVLRCP